MEKRMKRVYSSYGLKVSAKEWMDKDNYKQTRT
jgi:hypothetical protein